MNCRYRAGIVNLISVIGERSPFFSPPSIMPGIEINHHHATRASGCEDAELATREHEKLACGLHKRSVAWPCPAARAQIGLYAGEA